MGMRLRAAITLCPDGLSTEGIAKSRVGWRNAIKFLLGWIP